MLRVLIADDEAIARRRMLRLLKNEPGVEVVGECADGHEAVAMVEQLRPDVLFLDIQMPEYDGFAVLREIPADRLPTIVFTTAYAEFAVKAFEVSAADYLLKPFDRERVQAALGRVRRVRASGDGDDRAARLLALLGEFGLESDQLARRTPAPPAPRPEAPLDRLVVKTNGRVLFVRVADIDWVEAAGNYIRVHSQGRAHLVRETMTTLEERLDSHQFLRIHRGTIVNVDRIRELQPWFSGDYVVILGDGTKLRLSRSYRDRMETRLGRPI